MTEEQVFQAALELADEAARAAYLDETCGKDPALRRQVEALLAAHFKSGEFLDVPAAEQCQAGSRDDNTVAHEGDAVSAEKDHEDESDGLPFLAPSTRPDSLGRLGHYEVLQVLGKGGFGIVFRAFDETLQRVVAIKVMAPQIATLSPARKRFVREARSSAAVRHENVVQVYEVVEHPMPYLVMEFIPGETLQQRLDRTGPLDVSEVLRIGRQIAEGLAAAHANDLIHRDIKPANVLIEGGPQQRAKITDFGLARAADDASISQSGVIAGTPMFMAPEQTLGHKIDQRADLFSLGSVLYQMVSGRPPFRASSALAVLKRVAEEPPRPIPEIIPETPAWLCGIIAKLHAKNPDDRYQSAREVADVLADCEAQLKAHAKVKDFSRIPRGKPRRSGRWKWVAAALVLLALAGVGLFALTRPGPNSGGPGTEPPRSAAVAWGEVTDPLGDCRFTEANGRLTITVPGDRLHDLSPLPGCNLNSPRVLREVAGDFEARVTVLPYPRPTSLYSTGPHPAYVGAGLVVWSDEAGILRLFRAYSGGSFVTPEWYNGLALGGQKWIPVPEGPLHLRIRRTGDTLHLAYSTDGQTWTEVATATNLRPVSRVRVGVAVVNAIKQEFTVQFEGFEIKELPPSSLPPSVRTESGAKDKPSSPAIAPFTDADVQRIAALPAEQQVEEVRKELMRRNPGFDGKMEHKIEDGVVTEVRIVTDQVTDIAPIRVFNALQVLACTGTYTDKPNGLLADLTPLKGMNLAGLTHLDLGRTKVTDKGLAYFKDCKARTYLSLYGTNVGDAGLAPFKECKDLVFLDVGSTPVGDAGLAYFKDCKALTHLSLYGTNVGDAGLAPFKECKALVDLYLGGTKVSDTGLAQFKGMPLRGLGIDNTGVTDLTPLQGMPLEGIRLTPKNITRGLDILRDMKSLKTISIGFNHDWPATEFWERYDKGEFKE